MTYLDAKAGNIHFVDRLGKGGTGAVYVGYDEKLKRKVAVKAIRDDRLDAEARARLLREARILSRLDHPNICRIYDYLEGGQSDYLVLELVEGRTLKEALADGLSDRGLKLKIAGQIASALAAAHAEGIIHRDLKPGNVVLTPGGETKVLDFGLARFLTPEPGEWGTGDFVPLDRRTLENAAEIEGDSQPSPLPINTERGAVLGTLPYMSPEQARGERVTEASDMYSLGLVLQELFTGQSPYEPGLSAEMLRIKASDGDTLPATGLEPDLGRLIERLKALAPQARPSAAEALAELRRMRRGPWRHLPWTAAALIALALFAGALKIISDLRRERDAAVASKIETQRALSAAEQAARATALLALGRVEEARPLVDELLAAGWDDPEFHELCRRHGLLP